MKQEEERQLHNCSVRPRGNSHTSCLCACVCVPLSVWNSSFGLLNLSNDSFLLTSLQVVKACFCRPVVQWGSELTVDTACMCRHIPWCTLPIRACSSSASSSLLMLTVSPLRPLFPVTQRQYIRIQHTAGWSDLILFYKPLLLWHHIRPVRAWVCVFIYVCVCERDWVCLWLCVR